MFRVYWIAGIALGLAFTIGVLAQEKPPEEPVNPNSTQGQPPEQPAVEAPPVIPEVAPTEPTGTEHYDSAAKDRAEDASENNYLVFGEGWAQWVMAASGVVALLLSAWAVWLLRRTLEATRAAVISADAAVEVTRQLGEAQIRAYLYCRSARYVLRRDRITIIVEIANAGQSPASDVRVTCDFTINEVGGLPTHPRVHGWLTANTDTRHAQPVIANGSNLEEFHFFEDDFVIDEFRDEEFRRTMFRGGNEIMIDVKIRWSDVFGSHHEIDVFLSAGIDASPYNPRRKRAPKGRLDLRMDDTRHGIPKTDPE